MAVLLNVNPGKRRKIELLSAFNLLGEKSCSKVKVMLRVVLKPGKGEPKTKEMLPSPTGVTC